MREEKGLLVFLYMPPSSVIFDPGEVSDALKEIEAAKGMSEMESFLEVLGTYSPGGEEVRGCVLPSDDELGIAVREEGYERILVKAWPKGGIVDGAQRFSGFLKEEGGKILGRENGGRIFFSASPGQVLKSFRRYLLWLRERLPEILLDLAERYSRQREAWREICEQLSLEDPVKQFTWQENYLSLLIGGGEGRMFFLKEIEVFGEGEEKETLWRFLFELERYCKYLGRIAEIWGEISLLVLPSKGQISIDCSNGWIWIPEEALETLRRSFDVEEGRENSFLFLKLRGREDSEALLSFLSGLLEGGRDDKVSEKG